jgi:hypothetical protein
MLNPDVIHNHVSFLTCFCRLHSMTLVWQGLTERRKATSGHHKQYFTARQGKNAPDHYCENSFTAPLYILCDPSTDAARNMLHLCHLKLGHQKHKADKMSLITALRLGGVHKDILLIL